jgi:hypothetical protein
MADAGDKIVGAVFRSKGEILYVQRFAVASSSFLMLLKGYATS